METILVEMDRINFIVNEFMVFAKPHQLQFSSCNLNEILTSVVKFLEPEATLKNVAINFETSHESMHISGEKKQLKQVFLNLIKNSIEAIPTGGTIYIFFKKSTEKIAFIVKDEGIGMDLDQIKKL
ncbi:hypothetical protein J27TS8_22140 [Robertmurraya siralis]|uniref:Histidine kinase domain-containing protein n=1 Tax=Robertmurraya siralis TaxID=77777 RepID=A0A919WIA7_9BACI|nr:hypothetical protein J27TS8_22140 [Robertmurraya siralis]